MPYRRLVLLLVSGLVVLVVVFAVLMAFQALFAALGDGPAARVLGGVAVACLVLVGVDVLLLVGSLGILVMQAPASFWRETEERDDELPPPRSDER